MSDTPRMDELVRLLQKDNPVGDSAESREILDLAQLTTYPATVRPNDAGYIPSIDG